jgi:hypothetical protein
MAVRTNDRAVGVRPASGRRIVVRADGAVARRYGTQPDAWRDIWHGPTSANVTVWQQMASRARSGLTLVCKEALLTI